MKEDTALWHAKLPPGRYEIEVLQGCGKGSGGAEVLVDFGLGSSYGIGQHSLQQFKFTVEDTGHFQNFKPRVIGTLDVKKQEGENGMEFDVKVIPQTKPRRRSDGPAADSAAPGETGQQVLMDNPSCARYSRAEL